VVVSCEHASANVPAPYKKLFAGSRALLQSHRGYDIGALEIAKSVAKALGAPLVAGASTRLLVDLNRSMGHPAQFSELTRGLPAKAKHQIVRDHYRPYREHVERAVRERLARGGRVLHVSLHSFTPALNGQVRNADLGLLYDPRRAAEKRFCSVLQRELGARAPALTVRRNYPYRGVSDGFIPYLRKTWPDARYVGFEIEVNQHLARTPAILLSTAHLLCQALVSCVASA
jgi:predicted N-formylglutamate amidohydrolase